MEEHTNPVENPMHTTYVYEDFKIVRQRPALWLGQGLRGQIQQIDNTTVFDLSHIGLREIEEALNRVFNQQDSGAQLDVGSNAWQWRTINATRTNVPNENYNMENRSSVWMKLG